MALILFLVIHLCICLLAYLGIRSGFFQSSPLLMVLVALVPLWGFLCLCVLELRSRGNQEVREEVGIEKMRINDEIYRSILMDDDNAGDMVVPLQEALLVNQPKQRRELMMDVMYSGADSYVNQLKEARMNDDTEVVHYAITALVEIQKEFDLKFQKLDQEYEENPENSGLLFEYLDLLEEYLASGVLEGNMREIQEQRYSGLLSKAIDRRPDSRVFYEKKVRAKLRLGEYDGALDYARKMIERWPENETGYLLMIQYYAVVGDRDGIRKTLNILREGQIYLSSEGRSTVQFWKDEKERRQESDEGSEEKGSLTSI